MNSIINASNIHDSSFSSQILKWYDNNARNLPWRVAPDLSKAGKLPNPYHVWLSEIMLQQTQVVTVRAYYQKFLKKWPSIKTLANADHEDVLRAWAGLGYYSRARNLHKCARIISHELANQFPQEVNELKKLPGIGDYTAAAIASIAFGKSVAVVDGNIERIIARQFCISTPLPAAKKPIKHKVETFTPTERSGDFAQAMMDLGSEICSPKNPSCDLCPVSQTCLAHMQRQEELYPVKIKKPRKPTRKGAGFVIMNSNNEILLRTRADKGLLAGMREIPCTQWTARDDGETGDTALPFCGAWKKIGIIKHTFTHFHLEMEIWLIKNLSSAPVTGEWIAVTHLHKEALPNLMKKAIAVAKPDAFRK